MFQDRVLSGMRPTGQMHLGHYHGALKNWVKLQNEFPCLFFAADWHALTTHYGDPSVIEQTVWDMFIDWLAVGIDPTKATLFIQSRVPQHAELTLLLSFFTPLAWLERVPTYKDLVEKHDEQNLSLGDKERLYGFIEGGGRVILSEPEAKLTETPKLVGLDGQKMSKSYGNAILLREAPESVTKKIRTMQTDPARVRRSDPGNPEKCPVWNLHQVYSDSKTKDWVLNGCRTAGIGCLECKQPVIDSINAELKPIRERAAQYEDDPTTVRNIIQDGCEKASDIANDTMRDVRDAMGLNYE